MKWLWSAMLIWSVSIASGVQAKPADGIRELQSAKATKVSPVHHDLGRVASKQGTPNEINYQGWLGSATDTAGITDILNMVFRLIDAETGGAMLWDETQNNVVVDRGIFNVILGSTNPIPSGIFTGDPLWLEIQVGSDTLSPRKKLVSVGYAIKAEIADEAIRADTANYVAGANVDGEVALANRADTADYAITANVLYADSARISTDSYRWDGRVWGTEVPQANIADTANYVAGANVDGEVAQANMADTASYALSGPSGGGNWTLLGRVLHPSDEYGLAMRSGNVLHGNNDFTHVNFGIACTTGESGENHSYCTVSGGINNTASNIAATVGGGENNTASGWHATVGGGWNNTASNWQSTVDGGESNTASGRYAAVGGGRSNSASGEDATVGGGRSNTASGIHATVGGGQNNRATSESATVGGGEQNEASGRYATVGGGRNNMVINSDATVSGGRNHWAFADYATIPGGAYVRVDGKGSFGFGFGSAGNTVTVSDSFDIVFGDGGFRNYQFGINQESPAHPLHVGTDASNGNGAHLTAGGAWTNVSSREVKENFQELNGADVLNKVREMSVSKWRYKGTDEYHIGPVSEDFHNAFGVSEEKYLSSMDVSGVALIAIQELIQRLETQNQRLEAQQEEIEALKKKIAESEK